MLIVLFLVSHFNFLFVPCGGLSWLPVSFLLHVKYTLSYRIVSYIVVSIVVVVLDCCHISGFRRWTDFESFHYGRNIKTLKLEGWLTSMHKNY